MEMRIQYKILLMTFNCLHGLAHKCLSDLLHPYKPACSLQCRSCYGFTEDPPYYYYYYYCCCCYVILYYYLSLIHILPFYMLLWRKMYLAIAFCKFVVLHTMYGIMIYNWTVSYNTNDTWYEKDWFIHKTRIWLDTINCDMCIAGLYCKHCAQCCMCCFPIPFIAAE